MRDDQEPEFVAMLTQVFKLQRQALSPDVMEMWWEGLRGYALEDVRRAFNRHTFDPERGQFAPKPADIVRFLEGTRSDRAAVAWGKVFQAMGSVGAYRNVAFDDPLIHAVVQDMGGWPKLCRWPTEELSYAQTQFAKTYASLAERGVEGYPRVLSGDCSPDSEWDRKGLKPPAPVLIGDEKRCVLVIAGGGDPRAKVTELPAGTSIVDLVKLGGNLQLKISNAKTEELPE